MPEYRLQILKLILNLDDFGGIFDLCLWQRRLEAKANTAATIPITSAIPLYWLGQVIESCFVDGTSCVLQGWPALQRTSSRCRGGSISGGWGTSRRCPRKMMAVVAGADSI